MYQFACVGIMKYRLIKLVTSQVLHHSVGCRLAQIKDNQHKIIHCVKLKFCAHLYTYICITYSNMLNLLLSKATTRGLTHPAAMLFISQRTAVHMGSMTHSATECVYHNLPSVCGAVSVCTHQAGELCSEEAHNSQRSGCPLDYSE